MLRGVPRPWQEVCKKETERRGVEDLFVLWGSSYKHRPFEIIFCESLVLDG